MHNYDKVGNNMQKKIEMYTKVCKNIEKYEKVCKRVHMYANMKNK